MDNLEFRLDMQEVQKRRNKLKRKKRARFWAVGVFATILAVAAFLFSPIGPCRNVCFSNSSAAVEQGSTDNGESDPAIAPETPPPPPQSAVNPDEKVSDLRPPCVAIVVDDVGNGDANMSRWLAIDAPLTFSVMPYYAGNTSQAEQLHQAGFQVMMHIPKANKPPGSFSGKGQLEVGMSKATVFSVLDDDISQIPYAVGINNHQGGAGCDSLELMTSECEWALSRGYFVMDSNSSLKPQVAVAAVNLGMGRKKNQVFLDHDNDPAYIRQAMRNLADTARKNGYAIGICHWYRPNTPSTVGEMIEVLRAEGVHFAFVQYVNN